jgi:outer membrane protein TolC
MSKIFMTMKHLKHYGIAFLLLFSILKAESQELKILTFDEVIKLSEEQSPQALMAKHRFRASYWENRSFVANYLPSLVLSGTTPDLNNNFSRVFVNDGYTYRYTNTVENLATLALQQNIGLTGGTISLESQLTHSFDFEKDKNGQQGRQFTTNPVSIALRQPVFGYNSLKWQKKTEPLKYERAKKVFLTDMENVHSQATRNFFSLAVAQMNVQIAAMNYANADTLYGIAKGRYNLGTIAEDELLQMQLSWLNAETARKEAEINLRDREIRMRSFLGFNENVRLELIIPTEVPELQVSPQEVFDLAMQNNPEILSQQLNLLTAESAVARARADRFNVTLNASFGLRAQDINFENAYRDPNQQQRVRVGFSMPILDWGQGRGRVRMAQSSLELAQVQSNQAITDFQQNMLLQVEEFNLQSSLVATAALSDTVATRMFEVTKQRFLIGRADVLTLNNADTRKDQNKRSYVQALQSYWLSFFSLRSLTLYDFINRRPLDTDYDKLLD